MPFGRIFPKFWIRAVVVTRTHGNPLTRNLWPDLWRTDEPLTLRNLDDWPRSAHRRPRRFCCFHNVGEAHTIVFGPDCLEPMTHIAPEHERIRGGRSALL